MADKQHVREFLLSASETAYKMTSYPAILNETARDEDFPLLMPRWGYVVSAFVLFVIGFFGFFLNLMVIVLMFKDRQLWTPLNIILFNLVCSDFSVSVLGNPFTLISALFHRWVFGARMCMLYGFFMSLLGITSITTLTVISFERYLMVTRPLSGGRHLSSCGAVGLVLFIWTYSLALTTPPLYGWGKYVNEAANISCSVNWHEQSTNALTYIFFLFAMGQIVPMAVITFSYVNIIRTMRQNSQRLGRVNRAEARATSMVFVMILAFTVAWTPYSVFALMEQFATDGIISAGAGVIPALVAKSSICYNPVIYVGMNTQFRKSIKRAFGCHDPDDSDKPCRNTTMTSPAHRLMSFDLIPKFDTTSSSNPKKRNRFSSTDESEVTDHENKAYYKNVNLSTIQESKTGSDDAERSCETFCEEDSSNIKKNQTNEELRDTSEIASSSISLHENYGSAFQPIDCEQMTLQSQDEINEDHLQSNTYGNEGYEDHSTDATELELVDEERLQLKHSYSFEHPRITIDKRRRSMDAKIDPGMKTKLFFKDKTVVTKFLDQSVKQTNDKYQSCLYSIDDESAVDNL